MRINIDDTGNPDGILQIVSALPDPTNVPAETSIEVVFPNKYIFNAGLPILAAWRKRLSSTVKVSIDDSRCMENVRRILTNTGLRDILEKNFEAPAYSPHVHAKVPLQPIVPGFSTENAINRAYKMFDDYAGYGHDTKAFRVLLSEIVENSLVHGGIETPGYITAALHRGPRGENCEITIVDTGIGIRASYDEGSNDEIKRRIQSGASALEIALDGLSSSKPLALTPGGRSHFGFGLYTVRRLVELNRGRLTLISGDEAVTIDRFGKKRIPVEHPWHGTIVSILLDMGNSLALEEVYEEEVARLVPEEVRTGRGEHKRPVTSGEKSQPEAGSAMEVVDVRLADFGKELLARESGLAIRAELATLLASGSRIVVNLDGVDDITPSVADECFGKLAEKLGTTRFRQRVEFTGGTVLMHRLLDFVLAQRTAPKA